MKFSTNLKSQELFGSTALMGIVGRLSYLMLGYTLALVITKVG